MVLGPYLLLAELGSGGMGKVWRAEVTGRVAGLQQGSIVAIKIVHAHLLETEGFIRRFLREAEIGKRVVHENVVRTFAADSLVVGGARCDFLVMEYVEGQTLRALLTELERLPEELCRHIAREVARGLAAIHGAGAVHRDLKPENVLITRDHVVKVMDLGVARLAEESLRLSQSGAFVGSVLYAAPEQFRDASAVDGRADLHALGLILYEIATGQHPYRADDFPTVMHRVLETDPRRPAEINPQLSPYFEELVLQLLAKNRDDRFPSAAELARVLEEGERSSWWISRAKTIRAQTKRPLRRIRIPRETALHGRDPELARLRGLYQRVKSGEGQVLLVEGEAGIGKSRLLDEFVGLLQREGEEINFLWGSYPPGGAATASGAFSTAYREHFGGEMLEETLPAYLAETPILVPAFAALLRGEPASSGAEPLTKDSLQTVFVHATRALAQERPTIVVIEDLHFSPAEGRALFAALAMAVPGHRILLVGTTRPGIDEKWLAGIERVGATRLPLARLGPKDLVRLLGDAFHSEALAADLAGKVAVKSDGNPFFVFEIIRGLREGQFITCREDGTWVTTRMIGDLQIPASVLDLVSARVADLDDDERNLLDVACCCGFEFDGVLAGEVLGLPRVAALQRLAKIEKRHRLVRSIGRNYAFDHHQIQEALYDALHERLREEYHALIAAALEAQHAASTRDPGTLDGSLCVDLAGHLLKGAQGRRAMRYLDAALTHLESGYLNDQAIALSDRALALPGLLAGSERVETLLRKAARLDLLGRRKEQRRCLEEAMPLADAAGDAPLAARVRTALGGYYAGIARHDAAREVLAQALALAERGGDRKIEARTRGVLGNVSFLLGRYTEAREHYARWLAISREIGDLQGEARATGNLGNVAFSLGQYAEARAHHERAIAISRQVGDRRGVARGTGDLGSVFYSLGRYVEAQEHYAQRLAVDREIGDRRGEATATGSLGNVLCSLGRYSEGREYFERWLAISREIGDRHGETLAAGNLGTLLCALGDMRRARKALENSLAISRESGARYEEGHALASLAALADEEGDSTLAHHLLDESLALRREIGHMAGVAGSLLELGDLRRRAGDEGGARAAVEEAVSLSRSLGFKPELALGLALLACLPGGETRAAEVSLSDAGEAASAARVRFLLWQATHDPAHLAAARNLLDNLVAHAPPESRQSMVRDVRLHREIALAAREAGL